MMARAGAVVAVVVLGLASAACSVLDTSPGSADDGTTPVASTPTTMTTTPLEVLASPTTTTTPRVGPPRALVTSSGVVVPVRGGEPGAWVVGTPCDGEAVIADGGPIHGVTVLIDPGHGGEEPGAVGAGGLEEADLNLDVAARLAGALARRGIDSALTRTADYRIAVISRAELASAIRPEVFISIHHNAGESLVLDVPGVEVFHQERSPDSRRLAGLVFEELVEAFEPLGDVWFGGPARGVSARLNGDDDDLYGVLRRPVGVVSVLSEAMYLSNPAEEALLEDPSVRELEAEALASAIERYLSTDDPGSGFLETTVFRGDLGPGGSTIGCDDPALTTTAAAG